MKKTLSGLLVLVLLMTSLQPALAINVHRKINKPFAFLDEIAYGATQKEVKTVCKQVLGKAPSTETANELVYEYVNIGIGQSATLHFIFNGNKLVEIYYYWYSQYSDQLNDIETSVRKALVAEYGNYSNSPSGYISVPKTRSWSEYFDGPGSTFYYDDTLTRCPEWIIGYNDVVCIVSLRYYNSKITVHTRSGMIHSGPGGHIEVHYNLLTSEDITRIENEQKKPQGFL